MQRKLFGFATLAFALIGAVSWAAQDKKLSIDEIMQKVNGKKAGLHNKVNDGLKAASPAWDDLKKQMKEYHECAAALSKNDPPKGDKANWEKLSKAYEENAKKLQDAVDKKDKAEAKKAWDTIQKSCGACHDKHRP